MRIAIAADDAGRELKDIVKAKLIADGHDVVDFGLTESLPTADYPDFALPASEAVASGDCKYGVLVCGTGIGMSMCANKVTGIRCALLSDCFSAEATRLHNNANMIALGGRVIGSGLALKIIDVFFGTEFSEAERHERRINKITDIENKYFKA